MRSVGGIEVFNLIFAETYLDNLEEGQPTSAASIKVIVKDWQGPRSRDENFPDTNNLSGLSEKSDVDQVEISMPDFGLFEVKSRLQATPGGDGTNNNPYIFTFGPIEAETRPAGFYYGLIAVRDDLSGLGGPYPIQPKPGDDFPTPGPDITDYTAYQVLKV